MRRNKRKWRADRVGEDEWMLVEPKEVDDIYEEFEMGWTFFDSRKLDEAEKMLGEVVESAPTHIDALHHLAIIMDRKGRKEKARELWENAVEAGRDALPNEFKSGHRLDWGFLENRPFLRALHGLATFIFHEDEDIETALEIYEEIISYNPTDNQGIREILVELYLHQDELDKCIELCERYPGDILAGTAYGYPLALFKKGKREKATEELKKAIKSLPKVAKELLKEEHEMPETDRPGYITMGGWDQAYEYWLRYGEYWRKGELEWLETALS
ncbi:MAG: hypothetical protein R6U61_02260 [Thermoplasmata archaeon]